MAYLEELWISAISNHCNGSIEENKDRYTDCLKNIRRRLSGVLLHSELGPKTKLHMLYQGLFPVRAAKRDLKRSIEELKKDKME